MKRPQRYWRAVYCGIFTKMHARWAPFSQVILSAPCIPQHTPRRHSGQAARAIPPGPNYVAPGRWRRPNSRKNLSAESQRLPRDPKNTQNTSGRSTRVWYFGNCSAPCLNRSQHAGSAPWPFRVGHRGTLIWSQFLGFSDPNQSWGTCRYVAPTYVFHLVSQ